MILIACPNMPTLKKKLNDFIENFLSAFQFKCGLNWAGGGNQPVLVLKLSLLRLAHSCKKRTFQNCLLLRMAYNI